MSQIEEVSLENYEMSLNLKFYPALETNQRENGLIFIQKRFYPLVFSPCLQDLNRKFVWPDLISFSTRGDSQTRANRLDHATCRPGMDDCCQTGRKASVSWQLHAIKQRSTLESSL